MKTSTKIFIALVAAVAAVCAANAVYAKIQYNERQPEAEKLAAQIESANIRVVDFRDTNAIPWDISSRFSRTESTGNNIYLNLGNMPLQSARVAGDTLYLSGNRRNSWWSILYSPNLETVIVHRDGEPDEVFEYNTAALPAAE